MHTITTDSLSASGNIEFHLNARLDGLKAVPLTGKKYVVQDTFNCDFTIIGGPSAVPVFRNPELDVGGRRLDYPRIVIADHHIPTRVGVRLALEHHGFVVAAEEGTAPTAALRDPPDVCLLDFDVPCGRIEAAEAITSQLPETQLVMLGEAAKDEDV